MSASKTASSFVCCNSAPASRFKPLSGSNSHPFCPSYPCFLTNWPFNKDILRRSLFGAFASISTVPDIWGDATSIVPLRASVESFAQASRPPLAFAYLSEISAAVGNRSALAAVPCAFALAKRTTKKNKEKEQKRKIPLGFRLMSPSYLTWLPYCWGIFVTRLVGGLKEGQMHNRR